MTTTPEQRAEWKALCDTATAAPWVHDEYGDFIGVYCDDATGSIVAQFYPFKFAPRNEAEARANTILTVSSRTALPALISHVDALEAENARLRAMLAAAEKEKGG